MKAQEIKLPSRKYEPWIEVKATGTIVSLGKYPTETEAQEALNEVLTSVTASDSGIANAR